MSEQSLDAGETPATRRDATGQRHDERMQGFSRVLAGRVLSRADVVPIALVFLVVAVTGLPLGALWAALAPPRQSTFTTNGVPAPGLETIYHWFDPVAVFVLIGLAAGVVIGIALWALLRRHRGPAIVLAGALGSLLAAWLAIRFGGWIATVTHPLPPAPQPGAAIAVAPRVDTPWAIVAQPLGVAVVYGFAAAWNGLDDLGRGAPPTGDAPASAG